jgi:hypothetical protein
MANATTCDAPLTKTAISSIYIGATTAGQESRKEVLPQAAQKVDLHAAGGHHGSSTILHI